MPKIISPPKSQNENENQPIITTCSHCGYKISYFKDEEERIENIKMGIFCPHCEEPIITQNVDPFTFPNTFVKCGEDEGAVHITDKAVQILVNEVKKSLINDSQDYSFSETGDTIVFGYNFEDEIVIYVARNYWEDSVFR